MRGKPVCPLHGGKGGGPKGKRNGAYRTGRYTAEAKAETKATRVLIRELRRLNLPRFGLLALAWTRRPTLPFAALHLDSTITFRQARLKLYHLPRAGSLKASLPLGAIAALRGSRTSRFRLWH